MSNLEQRSGGVVIRLGGNTQEYATMVDSLPKGNTFSKAAFETNQTVSLIFLHYLYTFLNLFYHHFFSIFTRHKHRLFCIRSICFIWLLIFLRCSMLNGLWVCFISLHLKKKNPPPLSLETLSFFFLTLGIPFNDTVNWRLKIAEKGQQILGDNLLGLQAGNEPDYYAAFVSIFSFIFFSFFFFLSLSFSNLKFLFFF